MRTTPWMVGVVAVGLLAAGRAIADSGSGSSPGGKSTGSWSLQAPSEPDWPWRVYAGIASGYGGVSGAEYLHAPGGETVGLGLAVSFESAHWITEGGVGW